MCMLTTCLGGTGWWTLVCMRAACQVNTAHHRVAQQGGISYLVQAEAGCHVGGEGRQLLLCDIPVQHRVLCDTPLVTEKILPGCCECHPCKCLSMADKQHRCLQCPHSWWNLQPFTQAVRWQMGTSLQTSWVPVAAASSCLLRRC